MAFFWALEPDALRAPATQLVEPDAAGELVVEPLSEPQAASASAPASATAARRACAVMVTLVLQEVSKRFSVAPDVRKEG
jgi:hypothetical protein